MQVILQGSLRHFQPAELLSFLCNRAQNGTLDLETAGKRTRVFFESNHIIWAESNRGGEVVDVILETFEWTSGTFTVLDTMSLPENAKTLVLDIPMLVEEAKRRAAATEMYRDSATFRIAEDLSIQQQVSLTAEDLKLLFKLTSGRSFHDLIADFGITRKELTERLKRLEELGLLVKEDHETKTQPGPTQARRRTLVGSLTPDGAPGSVYPLLDGECSIGRSQTNTVSIADGSVSSQHARITRTPDGFVLEDLQSRNGTFVNGEKVTEKRTLADGDLIRLGKVILTFNVARETKSAETTQPDVRVS